MTQPIQLRKIPVINLTGLQDLASPAEQLGLVFSPPDNGVRNLLMFEVAPTPRQVIDRAKALALYARAMADSWESDLVRNQQPITEVKRVFIEGPNYLLPALEKALFRQGLQPFYLVGQPYAGHDARYMVSWRFIEPYDMDSPGFEWDPAPCTCDAVPCSCPR